MSRLYILFKKMAVYVCVGKDPPSGRPAETGSGKMAGIEARPFKVGDLVQLYETWFSDYRCYVGMRGIVLNQQRAGARYFYQIRVGKAILSAQHKDLRMISRR